MILKGEPNRPVTMRVKSFGGRRKIVHIFTFDADGLHEIDESKVSKTSLKRLMSTFEVIEDSKAVEVVDEVAEQPGEVEKILEDMTISELKEIAKTKGIEFNSRTRKNELIELLKN